LYFRDGSWWLMDLGSKNGTFLEAGGIRTRVHHPTMIASGQSIVVGVSTLQVTFGEAPVADPSAPTEPTPSHEARRRARARAREARRNLQMCEPRPETLLLRAKLDAGAVTYEFVEPHPLGGGHRVRFPARDIEAASDRLAGLARTSFRARSKATRGDLEATWHALRETGALLAQQLLPRSVARRLAGGAAGALLIGHSPDLIAVPWELMRVEDEFLCLQYAMGRQILTQISFSSLTRHDKNDAADLRVLIVCNPTQDLPQAQAAAERILAALESAHPNLRVEFLAGPRVRRFELLARLAQADIVYYGGHADYDADQPAESGWQLKGERVTCADFRSLARPPLLVFANGCETGREGDWLDVPGPADAAYGLASAFLFAGVSSYIGAIWPIPEPSSAAFAMSFFGNLIEGSTVGESVREARRAAIDKRGAGNLAWASYVYYGDPSYQFPPLAGD
jgi:CHAT domain-containing protein